MGQGIGLNGKESIRKMFGIKDKRNGRVTEGESNIGF
jgi:hypothetical protein